MDCLLILYDEKANSFALNDGKSIINNYFKINPEEFTVLSKPKEITARNIEELVSNANIEFSKIVEEMKIKDNGRFYLFIPLIQFQGELNSYNLIQFYSTNIPRCKI
ncbi:MAG: hypothetical protein AABX61_00470 [Nanoarchaeota archaeon]